MRGNGERQDAGTFSKADRRGIELGRPDVGVDFGAGELSDLLRFQRPASPLTSMAKVASRPSVEAEALVTSNAGGTAASGLEWISWAKAEVASAPWSRMKFPSRAWA
jgi:hypothetical protein